MDLQLTKKVSECPGTVSSLNLSNFSRRSKITCSKSSRFVPFFSRSSTTAFTMARNCRSISLETNLLDNRVSESWTNAASHIDSRDFQYFVHERHEQDNLLLEASDEARLEDVVTYAT